MNVFVDFYMDVNLCLLSVACRRWRRSCVLRWRRGPGSARALCLPAPSVSPWLSSSSCCRCSSFLQPSKSTIKAPIVLLANYFVDLIIWVCFTKANWFRLRLRQLSTLMADAGMTLDCFVYIMQEMMLNDGHASFNYVGLPRLVEITSQDSSQGCQGCSGCPRIPENPPRESSLRMGRPSRRIGLK